MYVYLTLIKITFNNLSFTVMFSIYICIVILTNYKVMLFALLLIKGRIKLQQIYFKFHISFFGFNIHFDENSFSIRNQQLSICIIFKKLKVIFNVLFRFGCVLLSTILLTFFTLPFPSSV